LKNGKFRNVDTLFGWNTGEGYGFVPNTMPNLPLDHNDLMLSIQDIVQSRLIDINGHPIDWSSYKTEFNLDSHTIDEIDTETYRDIRDFIKYSAFASSTKEFVDQMKINEARSELNLIPKNHYMYNFDYFY
jgi:hypothetical protein